jgi:hypothetical protein
MESELNRPRQGGKDPFSFFIRLQGFLIGHPPEQGVVFSIFFLVELDGLFSWQFHRIKKTDNAGLLSLGS